MKTKNCESLSYRGNDKSIVEDYRCKLLIVSFFGMVFNWCLVKCLYLINIIQLRFYHLIKMFRQYVSGISNIVNSGGKKSNAFTPILKLIGIFAITFIPIALYLNGIIVYIMLGVLMFLFLGAVIIYLIIFFKDPKLLQSESYRIEERKLEIVSEKGGALVINPVNIPLISEGNRGDG
jgi:hypothetical protein